MNALLALTGLLAATASASVRTDRVEVGEPVAVTVTVQSRPTALVQIRPPAAQPPAFTVESGGQRLQQATASGKTTFTWQFVPWTHGKLVLPPTEVEVDGIRGLRSNRIVLTAFNPLGKDAADAEPRDIRDIRPFPVRPPMLLYAMLGALIAAVAWWWMRPRETPQPQAPPPRPVAPAPSVRRETLAEMMERVRRLAEGPPRDPAGIRHAHFVIAEAVRRFVEERWDVPASRQTTEEFLAGVARENRFRGGGMNLLPVVLEACDRVKWADESVTPQETLEVARLALDIFAASRGAVHRGLGGGPGERARAEDAP